MRICGYDGAVRRRLFIAIVLAGVGVAALLGLLSSRIEPETPTCPVPSGSRRDR
jgi:hypothetical protein